MSELDFEARIHAERIQKDIDEILARIKQMGKGVEKEGKSIDDTIKRWGAGLAAFISVRQIGSFIGQIARVRGEFQDLNTAFSTILRSKEKADRLMAEVVQFAATTPFNLKDVAAGTKQLLAYGFAADGIIGNLRMLGDVAAGTSTPIGDLIYLYGTLQTQGRAYTRDIMQFTSRGIPMIEALAKVMGVAKSEVKDMVEAGRVGFPEVEKAFQSMTGAGGMFGGLMEQQAKNINGLYSNLQDKIVQAQNAIGESSEGAIAGAIKMATTLVDHYKEIGTAILTIISTYGAYKAAIMATNVAIAMQTRLGVYDVATKNLSIIATIKATIAQSALNKALWANPYAAVIAGAIAFIGVLAVLAPKVKTLEDYMSDLDEAMASMGRQMETDALIKKYEELKAITNRTAEQQTELNQTIQALAAIFPEAISGYDQYGKAIDLVSAKLYENNQQLREYLKQTTGESIADAKQQLLGLQKDQQRYLEMLNTGKQRIETVDSYNVKHVSFSPLNKADIENARKQLDETNASITKLYAKIETGERELAKFNAADAQQFINANKAMFEDASKFSKEKAIQTRDELIKLYTSGLVTNPNVQDAIKKQAQALNDRANSIKLVGDIMKKANTDLVEAERKLEQMKKNSYETAGETYQQELEAQEDLVKRLRELTGKKKSDIEQQIKDRQAQIQAEQRLSDRSVEITRATETSKAQIIQSATQRQIKEADNALQANLDNIQRQKDAYLEALNEKSGKNITDADYITTVPKDIQDQLDEQEMAARTLHLRQVEQINREAAKEIQQIWQQSGEVFATELERQKNSIIDKYESLIDKAKELGASMEDIQKLKNARSQETNEAILQDRLRQIDFQLQLDDQMAELQAQGLNREETLEAKRAQNYKKAIYDKMVVLRRSHTEENQAQLQILANEWKIIDAQEKRKLSAAQYLSLSREISSALIQQMNITEQEKQMLESMMDSFDTLLKKGLFSKDGLKLGKEEGAAMAIQNIASMISMIGNQSRANKQAQQEWNDVILEAEQRMRLLNLQALEYKEANIFGVENPYAKAIAGAKQYSLAMKMMAEQSALISQGMVKTGTKKVPSGANIAAGTTAGVITAIGAAAGPIGMAIGGAIGGAIALFAAKKRVDVYDSIQKVYGYVYDKQTFELNPKILADYGKLDEATKKIVDNWKEIKEVAEGAQQQMEDNFRDLAGDLGKSLSDSLVEAFRNKDLDSAIDSFHKKVGDVIADIIRQMLFSQFLQPMFDEAADGFRASFGLIKDKDTGLVRAMTDEEKAKKISMDDAANAKYEEAKRLRNLAFKELEDAQREIDLREKAGKEPTATQQARLRRAQQEFKDRDAAFKLLNSSYKDLVDYDITDDLEKLGNDVKQGVIGFNEAMILADAMLKAKGFENGIAGGGPGEASGENSQKRLEGAVKGITEETASILAGHIMAIRDYQFRRMKTDEDTAYLIASKFGIFTANLQSSTLQGREMLDAVNIQSGHLSKIERNTQNNAALPEIRDELKKMNRTLSDKL